MEAKILYLCDPNKNKDCGKETCKHNRDAKYNVCEYTTRKEFSTDGIPTLIPCPHCRTLNTMDNYEELSLVGKAVVECKGCEKLFILRDDGDGEYVYAPGVE